MLGLLHTLISYCQMKKIAIPTFCVLIAILAATAFEFPPFTNLYRPLQAQGEVKTHVIDQTITPPMIDHPKPHVSVEPVRHSKIETTPSPMPWFGGFKTRFTKLMLAQTYSPALIQTLLDRIADDTHRDVIGTEALEAAIADVMGDDASEEERKMVYSLIIQSLTTDTHAK